MSMNTTEVVGSTNASCIHGELRDDTTGAVVFILYFVGHLVCLLYSISIVLKSRKIFALWLALPLGFCLCFETLMIAVFEANGSRLSEGAAIARFVMHSFIISIFLVFMFEVVYIIHKRRSVNFCGITFDQGHRSHELWSSRFMRMSMWVIAIGLTVIELIATIIIADTDALIIANNKSTRFCSKSILEAIQRENSFEMLVDILPGICLMVFSVYFGLLLWRYGTHYAFKVHATYFNPWVVVFASACCLLVSFWVPGPPAAFLVDGGLLLLHLSLVWVVSEMLSELARGEEVKMYLSKRSVATTDDGQGSTSASERRDSCSPQTLEKHDTGTNENNVPIPEETQLTMV